MGRPRGRGQVWEADPVSRPLFTQTFLRHSVIHQTGETVPKAQEDQEAHTRMTPGPTAPVLVASSPLRSEPLPGCLQPRH